MITIEKEKTDIEVQAQEIDKEAMCYKLCANILEGLLQGYSDLKEKNPEKQDEFQSKIEELKKQFQLN